MCPIIGLYRTQNGGRVPGVSMTPGPSLPATLEDMADDARRYIASAKAPATLRAYRSDWAHFCAWCDLHGRAALPAEAETVALYLSDLARVAKPATLQRRLSSISQAHQAAGHPTPTAEPVVRAVHAGIRRTQGTAPTVKAPAVTAELRAMVAHLPDDLRGTRDRAMLLVGFAAALRRSELVALDVVDVTETAEGLVVTLRRSKTDQEGAGRKIGVPYGSNSATCPVRALRAWIDTASVIDGPLFLTIDRAGRLGDARASDRAVARAVQRAAQGAGLDPARYAGHSLRAGLATSAAAAGVSERSIMNQTGHKSLPILRRYIRNGNLFTENAAASVGL
jgi:site-specific recombinase XerD